MLVSACNSSVAPSLAVGIFVPQNEGAIIHLQGHVVMLDRGINSPPETLVGMATCGSFVSILVRFICNVDQLLQANLPEKTL